MAYSAKMLPTNAKVLLTALPCFNNLTGFSASCPSPALLGPWNPPRLLGLYTDKYGAALIACSKRER